jgi:hypothetical protein
MVKPDIRISGEHDIVGDLRRIAIGGCHESPAISRRN